MIIAKAHFISLAKGVKSKNDNVLYVVARITKTAFYNLSLNLHLPLCAKVISPGPIFLTHDHCTAPIKWDAHNVEMVPLKIQKGSIKKYLGPSKFCAGPIIL